MSRGKGKRFRRGGRGGGEPDAKRSRDANGGQVDGWWQFAPGQVPKNEKFEQYYKAQNIIPEEDFQLFLDTLNKSLPATFRINPLAPEADAIRNRLKTDPEFSKEFTLDDGTVVPAPRPLSWYEDAWQLGYGKPDLRKNNSLKKFHEWIVVMTSNGGISRQEAVSMIPPMLLDVQPHHYVLDMCAAPGSKTAQLLEALHIGELAGKQPATGLVIANDCDSKRAYMLTHQVQRLRSTSIVVTCHDAQLFPNLNKGGYITANSAPSTPEEEAAFQLMKEAPAGKYQRTPGCFDRVLADVPCSGDGTARKNGDVLIRWTPSGALALHPLQIQIAMRGLALLKVGGLMAYSTCSLNPIEDEAVVAEVLRRCGGAVELVDVSHLLPNLKRSDGIFTWKVLDKDMREYESFEASQERNPQGNTYRGARKLTASMFPPSLEVARDQYKLNRCMRVLPHAQDTGGFFICVLKKTAPLPSSKPWFQPESLDQNAPSVPQGDGAAVDSEDEIDNATVKPFYGLAGHGDAASAPSPAADPTATPAADTDAKTEIDAGAEDVTPTTETPAPVQDDDSEAEDATPSTGNSAADTAGANPKLHRDGKGRVLSGRYELTVFSPIGQEQADAIRQGLGLHPDFPMHMLHNRVDGGGSLTLMSGAVSTDVIPHQRTSDGNGRVKLINAGIKILQETKGSEKRYFEKHDATAAEGEEVSERKDSSSSFLGIRIIQEGLSLLAPWMSRQIVHVSGNELVTLLKFRGQFVTIDTFTPRLQAALKAVKMGSFAVIVNPAIDGHESATTITGKAGDSTSTEMPDWVHTVNVDNEGSCAPREVVPIAYEAAIAPILKQHYVQEGDNLVFRPSQRIFPGDNPISRVFLSMWKGRHKYNLMINAPDTKGLVELLKAANYHNAV